MNLSNVEELKTFLKHSSLRPKDYLGQNFLVDEDVLHEIVQAADLKSSDTVLEVGSGLGVLTAELVPKVKKLIAVEKDPKLFSILRADFKNHVHMELFNEDILKFHLAKNIPGDYKVVANIPYYLTSKLFQLFLSASDRPSRDGENEHPPKFLVLMVQKEVGERVVAGPGDLSILGISVQVYADAEIVSAKIPARRPQPIPDLSANKNKSYGQDPGSNQGGVRDGFGEKKIPLIIPKTSFWPVPKVDSVILKITPRNKYPEIKDKKLFFRILKMAFAGKRKQIHNTLAAGLNLSKEEIFKLLKEAGIEPTTRPQDLAIDDWIRLYKKIENLKI